MRRGRSRLNRDDARIWNRSEAIIAVRVPPVPALGAWARNIAAALADGDRGRTQRASQGLVDALCRLLRVPPLQVEVRDTRPRNGYGELHGLYVPANGRRLRDGVRVWMRTAQRQQTVAFKTFLRTLLHEVCHHLDYERFKLGRSFHTAGFYKRESSLMYAVLPRDRDCGRQPTRTAVEDTNSAPMLRAWQDDGEA